MPELRVDHGSQLSYDDHREIKFLLDMIVEPSGSDYVLFRMEVPGQPNDIPMLRLEAFAAAPNAPPVDTEFFTIPIEKETVCWAEHPLRSWGRTSFPEGALEQSENCKYNFGEQQFLRLVKHKASFPIALCDNRLGVLILLSGGEISPYTNDRMIAWWTIAQLYLSRRSGDDLHAGLVQAVQCLPLVVSAHDMQTVLQMFCHCLASAKGLQNNRVWLLKELDNEQRFECVACLGEANIERWRDASTSAQRDFRRLTHELSAVAMNGDTADSLWSVCAGSESLVVDLYSDEIIAGPSRVSEQHDFAQSLLEAVPAKACERFQDAIKVRLESRDTSMTRESSLLWYPLVLAGTRYVIILGSAYTGQKGPATSVLVPVLTEMFNHVAESSRDTELSSRADSFMHMISPWLTRMGFPFEDVAEFQSVVNALSTLREFHHDVNARQKYLERARDAGIVDQDEIDNMLARNHG
jgi:hypothetical protein